MSGGRTASLAANVLAQQAGWLACVLGAAYGMDLAGASLALALTAAHVALAVRPRLELRVVLAAAALGAVVDSAHSALGILDFEGFALGGLAPLWIVALWLQFGTVLHFGLRWLSGRYLLAAALGAVGGPLSFLTGERMGAATFGEPRWLSMAVLALSWSLALPMLVAIADRWRGAGRYRIFDTEAGSSADDRPSARTIPFRRPDDAIRSTTDTTTDGELSSWRRKTS